MAVLNAVKHTWTNVGIYSSGPVDVSLYQELLVDSEVTALTIAADKYVQMTLSRLDAFGNVVQINPLFAYYGNALPTLPVHASLIVENGFGGQIQIDMFTNDSTSRISGTLSVLAKGISLL